MTTEGNEHKGSAEMDRRRFIVAAAGGVAALAVGAIGLVAPAKAIANESKVVSPQQQLCIGCLTCEVACSSWHASQAQSPLPRIRVLRTSDAKPDKAVSEFAGGIGFEPRGCRQCPNPECLVVCPVKAMRIDATTGARYIDEKACIGCGKCEEACPYPFKGMAAGTTQNLDSKRIFYDPDRKVYVKCDLCRGRQNGPVCIEQCPVNLGISQGRIDSSKKTLILDDCTPSAWKDIP